MTFEAIGALLDASHHLHPDDVGPAIAAAGVGMGANAIGVFVVDYDQRRLVSLLTDDTLDVDGTIPGRAFQLQQVTESPGDPRTFWVPLTDGADRVGVLGVTTDNKTEEFRALAGWLASVAADLIVGKHQFGDGIERARRSRDMELAAELRWAMLPPLTFSERRIAIAGILEPAYEIAGDCFDYALNGDIAHLAILDAVGHGLEASRIANLAVTAYRHERRGGSDLRETFVAVDAVVHSELGPEKFVTAQFAELALSAGRLHLLNAGHPHPILLRAGGKPTDVVCDPTPPLGLGHLPVEEVTIQLEPGDHLLFFTDGVVEARAPSGELFGRDRLADLLVKATAMHLPVAETVRRLCHAVVEHEAARLQDDATLLLVRWTNRDAG